MKKNLLSVYFGLIALASFIWLCIMFIIFANNLISKAVITDEEYMSMSQNSREITRCEEPIYLNDKSRERTAVEKEECILKAKEKLILERNMRSKEKIIYSSIGLFLLLIIFPIHFVNFRKTAKQQ